MELAFIIDTCLLFLAATVRPPCPFFSTFHFQLVNNNFEGVSSLSWFFLSSFPLFYTANWSRYVENGKFSYSINSLPFYKHKCICLKNSENELKLLPLYLCIPSLYVFFCEITAVTVAAVALKNESCCLVYFPFCLSISSYSGFFSEGTRKQPWAIKSQHKRNAS